MQLCKKVSKHGYGIGKACRRLVMVVLCEERGRRWPRRGRDIIGVTVAMDPESAVNFFFNMAAHTLCNYLEHRYAKDC